jgi:glycosyltransferase involved in cell wall biosynthesis
MSLPALVDVHPGGNCQDVAQVDAAFYPRVLIVNVQPFNRVTATGITLGSLFRDWPRARLAQVYTCDLPPDSEFDIPTRRLLPADLRLPKSLTARLAGPADRSTSARGTPRTPRGQSDSPAGGPLRSLMPARVKTELMQLLRLAGYDLAGGLSAWVEGFQPDVIYSWLEDIALLKLVAELSHRYAVPVVPHFFDDWPATLHRNSPLSVVLRPALSRALRSVIARSSHCLTVGDAMAEEYASQFGGPFTAIMNCVDPALLDLDTPAPSRPGVRFAYVGHLHGNRPSALTEIAEALADVGANERLSTELLVYAPPADLEQHGAKLAGDPVLRVMGSLAKEDVPGAQRDADCLIHVESFDREAMTYARLSLSTKIPEYMSAGRPIFAYGPLELASLRYILDSGCGLVVGHRNRLALVEGLRQLVVSPELRCRLGRRGKEVARERHDGARQRENLRIILANSAQEREQHVRG